MGELHVVKLWGDQAGEVALTNRISFRNLAYEYWSPTSSREVDGADQTVDPAREETYAIAGYARASHPSGPGERRKPTLVD
jgi:hypothetical protein